MISNSSFRAGGVQEGNERVVMEQDFQKRKATIGSVLTDARNQAALSQADVAKRMNLMVRTIQALEEDDFKNLPGPTYVRGYLRTYARLVGLDSEQLVRIYSQEFPVGSENHPPSHPSRGRRSAVLWGGAVLFALLGVYVLLQVYGLQPSAQVLSSTDIPKNPVLESAGGAEATDTELSVDQESFVEAQIDALDEPVPESADEPQGPVLSTEEFRTQGIPIMEAADDEQTSSPAEASVQVVGEQPVAFDPPASDESLEVLTISFLEDSWVEVRDADMQLLLWDLIRSGATIEIKGKAPFEVLLGNSPDVIIEVDGNRFDHSRFHQSDRTSQFKVSRSLLH